MSHLNRNLFICLEATAGKMDEFPGDQKRSRFLGRARLQGASWDGCEKRVEEDRVGARAKGKLSLDAPLSCIRSLDTSESDKTKFI